VSHISVYKTNVKIDENTLYNAVERLAKKIGADIGKYVTDYYGNTRSVVIALIPKDMPRGIGFTVRNGELEVVGDPYGYKDKFYKYSELVKNYINAYLVRKKTYRLFPTARIREKIREEVVELEVEI